MHTTNYFDTFISVAADCPVHTGEIPPEKHPKSAAQIQHDLLIDHPYELTSDDVMFMSNGERRGIERNEFFSKGQPCFRSSPLVKRYGWGVHSNKEGKIAIYPVGSSRYEELSGDSNLKQLLGMRSKRA